MIADQGVRRSVRYLPHVIVATTVVAVVPIVAVWTLRNGGTIGSAWVGVPLTVVLSLLFASIGSVYWQRHRRPEDLTFNELLLWGWLRRLYAEHRVNRAISLLGLASGKPRRDATLTLRRRTQLLSQLARALEAQDSYLQGHSRRVSRHAAMIARRMRLSRGAVAKIRLAGALHDVGKVRVSTAVLNKRGRLTAAEFEIVKRHADEGAKIVACLEDQELAAIVRHHHERMDGSGYPGGLRGEQIPLGARVVAVADTYDAITAARPYRPAAPHKRAFEALADESLTHLDPVVVRAFLACYSDRRALALWETLLASLPQAFAWARVRSMDRPRGSLRQVVSGTGATVAIAAVAIAAPIAVRRRAQQPPPPRSTVVAARAPVHAKPTARRPRRRRPVRHRSPVAAPAVSHHTVLANVTPASRLPTTVRSVRRARTHARARTLTSAPTHPSPLPSSPAPAAKHPTRPPASAPSKPTHSAPPVTPPTPVTTPSSSPAPVPSPIPQTPPAPAPVGKDQCKHGGYTQYGFKNQGQCVAAAEHHG
jgi:hypothetical protein